MAISSGWRPVAFKEWQLVADAIAKGGQSVILRKGGISEGKYGFQWLHDRFLLFPSRFHEQVHQVRPDAGGGRRILPASDVDEGRIAFSVYVEVSQHGRLEDWDAVLALSPYHIWTEEVIRERYEWGDSPGISWATIRAWVLQDPWVLEDRKGFGGCRSWIGLPPDEKGGWQGYLANATEVRFDCGYPGGLI